MSEHRVVLIESPATLNIELGRLKISRKGKKSSFILPSDMSVLVLHHHTISLSQPTLAALGEYGVVILATNQQHVPTFYGTGTNSHVLQNQRLALQIKWQKKRLSRQIWKQLIVTKIKNQSKVLQSLGGKSAFALERLARQVKLSNTTNIEAQAARLYWRDLLEDFTVTRIKKGATDPINSQLNFGYAILRSALIRSILSSGLHPSLGMGHHSESNQYNLADDFIEPLRFLVESHVLSRVEHTELTPSMKVDLASITTTNLTFTDGTYRFHTGLQKIINSYVNVLQDGKGKLALPIW